MLLKVQLTEKEVIYMREEGLNFIDKKGKIVIIDMEKESLTRDVDDNAFLVSEM